jgi:ATP-dependent exoDNAse (exonuclease V) beta subunit
MLTNHEDIRWRYQTQFKHMLIDEFQDTNKLQYKLLSSSTQKINESLLLGMMTSLSIAGEVLLLNICFLLSGTFIQ